MGCWITSAMRVDDTGQVKSDACRDTAALLGCATKRKGNSSIRRPPPELAQLLRTNRARQAGTRGKAESGHVGRLEQPLPRRARSGGQCRERMLAASDLCGRRDTY